MKYFWLSFRYLFVMAVLTGLVYPFLITFLAQKTMPEQANGSLLYDSNQHVIGSQLIAQNFSEDRYLWPRPSQIYFDPLAAPCKAYGPTSRTLRDSIDAKRSLYASLGAELLVCSGSGLDPHISLSCALAQVPRIARARSLKEAVVRDVITSLAEGKQFYILGPSYVNVLLVNWTLDAQCSISK